MTHLTGAEFADLLDGRLGSARAAHVAGCAACRDEAEALGAARALALEAGVPEPSPMFWDRFGARVAEAIREPGKPRPRPWPGWAPSWTGWAGGAVIGLLIVVSSWLARAPVAPDRQSVAPPDAPAAAVFRDHLDEDLDWLVVRAAAEDLAPDEAEALGMAPRPGAADAVLLELSEEERAELTRLLEAELKRSGA
jgi:hypothetical protein